MKKFYLHDSISEHGPYDIDELRQQNISPRTPVWYEGLENWTPAEKVEELKGLFKNSPPPYHDTDTTQYHISTPANLPGRKQTNRKAWIIGLCITSVIFALIIFFANKKDNVTALPGTGTTPVVDSQKTRLQELEEKERQRRALENAQQIIDREYRNNWRKYITLKASNFKVGFFGGIKDLEITVTNTTEHIVDEVVVKVDYIKESGEVYASKEVVLNNIQPGTSKSSKAPETSRGIKVKTDISRVTARALSFCFDVTKDAERRSAHAVDPYKCR